MNQKEEERLIIEYFRESWPDFPKGKLVVSESPDFVLKIAPKKAVGIELTRLDPKASSLKDRIEATLQNKNGKFTLYQQKYMNVIWLIIHADFIEASKSYNIQQKLNSWKFETKFKMVFLFDIFEKRIYQINVN